MDDRLRLHALLLISNGTATHFNPTDVSPIDFQKMSASDITRKLYLQ